MEMLSSLTPSISFQAKKSAQSISKNFFETEAWQVQKTVCGIDEVGRGCLAGPLVTAAVILPSEKINPLITDSKLMSEEARIAAYTWIIEHCQYGIGIVHHRVIDTHNIWQATLIAMQKAVMHLMAKGTPYPTAFLVDAMPLRLQSTALAHIPVYHFPKGELLSSSIAAASIVAKVCRDTLITQMEAHIPGYYLAQHKGYATKKHYLALNNNPISLIHRVTFLKKEAAIIKKESHEASQQRIC